MIAELKQLRGRYPALDLADRLINEINAPPAGQEECIFARTIETISADLKTHISPRQFGGTPDCTQCGCIASMGLAALSHHRVLGPLTAGHLFLASDRIGKGWRSLQEIVARKRTPAPQFSPFKIL